ncbi:SHOCT domain-containing protein [Fredinandcohnia humi]
MRRFFIWSNSIIHIAQELKSLIDSLLHSNPIQTASSNTSIDIADQIKKLADLRDSGILTDEEFNDKKKQLLDI